MTAAFEREWKLYRRDANRAPLAGLPPRTDGTFDPDPKPGEIRIFADMNRPFLALVAASRGPSGWRIIPLSPFSAPASVRERAVGDRVYQLWNATVASRTFVSRSWLVETVPDGVRAALDAAVPAARPGRIRSGDGAVARYEREFLVSAGDFVPFAAPAAAARIRWLAPALKVAASFAVCVLAGTVLMTGGGRRLVREWREVVFPAAPPAAEAETIELCEGTEPLDPPLAEPEVRVDVPQVPAVVVGPVAEVHAPVSVHGWQTQLTERVAQKRPDLRFADPLANPSATVVLGAPADAGNARFAYGSSAPPAAQESVRCRLVRCPWNRRHALLNIAGPVTRGAEAVVEFAQDRVEGYRRIPAAADAGEVNAYFEVMPFAGRDLDGALKVTLVRTGPDAGREALAVEPAEPAELRHVPAFRDGPGGTVSRRAFSNDVPVSVAF